MNPLTQIKNTQKVTKQEIAAGVTDAGSWHARFKHSAYIFAGGLAYQLTEGDLLAVFSQYGEVVDVNLVKDRDTGKSRGFAFLAYEDQRSTVLAVDNLSGAQVAKRTIRVDHVDNYKIKRAEVEGREVSDSEEEDEGEEDDDYGAQDAAVRAAQLDGATVEHIDSSKATGAPQEDPWASKTSVLAALQEAGPMRPKRPHAEHDAEDPMRGMQSGGDLEDPLLSMGAERQAKKAKKEKKEKKEKKKSDKSKKNKQRSDKEQGLAGEAEDEGRTAAAGREADLRSSPHTHGPRKPDPGRGSGQQGTGDGRDPQQDQRRHHGEGRHEQEHRNGRERSVGRHRERGHSRERIHRHDDRERDRDRGHDRSGRR